MKAEDYLKAVEILNQALFEEHDCVEAPICILSNDQVNQILFDQTVLFSSEDDIEPETQDEFILLLKKKFNSYADTVFELKFKID